jgi:hypothetical protein
MYSIDERMKQLGRWERYAKELSRIATAKKIPAGWVLPISGAELQLRRRESGGLADFGSGIV